MKTTAGNAPAILFLAIFCGSPQESGKPICSNIFKPWSVPCCFGHGLDRWRALLDACHKRARPIIMTTVAMGAGMLPIALGIGTDPSFRAPMAIVVIGGLITSTFLSLLVIPVVFTFVDDLIGRVRARLGMTPH
jgi:hypothetical protein